ncbi:hypothetical protein Flavo103_00510 [Flavobacterium collinsii]|uniref:hypothetical protein n=1 Tax=Flavobacterium collinsii TaxID=1114861 RepID=UPI0022BDADC4|nr:hypothetical protein [Flavobacterium collinsii]GIQ56915.1 hypothetical protein Flavo103_00510 [Flavobacterium collinsii]
MKKIILSLLIVFMILTGGYLFYNFQKNTPKERSFKTLNFKDFVSNPKIKDLDPKSLIMLFREKYNPDSILNTVTLSGDFPENWVKPNDVAYLISIMRSKEKCCGYTNIFSSTLSDDHGEIGGFAIIFLNSYISNTKINLGLNCNPKVDEESVIKIEKWFKKTTYFKNNSSVK